MITVWTTPSKLNRTICKAFLRGLKSTRTPAELRAAAEYDRMPVESASYGFLRGIDRIYQDCATARVQWWNIDKGFFRASHTDGYYRIGCEHLQPLFDSKRKYSRTRWELLGIDIGEWRFLENGIVLICPPTPALSGFYKINEGIWIAETIAKIPEKLRSSIVVRKKTDTAPLSDVLDQTRVVITHSSNVAIEALIRGIPAISETGIVQTWNKLQPSSADINLTEMRRLERLELFHQAAWKQFTLSEIESGFAWRTLYQSKPNIG